MNRHKDVIRIKEELKDMGEDGDFEYEYEDGDEDDLEYEYEEDWEDK